MKKILGLLLLCAAMVGFASCEKDEDGFTISQIIGTWEAAQCKVDGEWINIPPYSDLSITMTFYENGRYYGKSNIFGTGWGTYDLSGNTIKTYIDGKLLYTYHIKSLTNTFAEISMSSGKSTIDFRLTKK